MESYSQLKAQKSDLIASVIAFCAEVDSLNEEVILYKQSGIMNDSQLDYFINKAQEYNQKLLSYADQFKTLDEKISNLLPANNPAQEIVQEETKEECSDSSDSGEEDFQFYRE
jgi:hypothetical protein